MDATEVTLVEEAGGGLRMLRQSCEGAGGVVREERRRSPELGHGGLGAVEEVQEGTGSRGVVGLVAMRRASLKRGTQRASTLAQIRKQRNRSRAR